MKITISGTPGSGKNTIGEILANKLKYRLYNIGDLRREIAKKMNLSLEEFNKLGESEGFTDKDVDKIIQEIGKTQDNFIVNGRLAFHFIPDSVKIFLKVSLEESAKRILKDKRTEESYKDLNEAKKGIQNIMTSDTKRYKKYYNTNCYNESNHDFVLDTTNLTKEQVLSEILNFLEKFIKEENFNIKDDI